MGAVLSGCGRYRYVLWRDWADGPKALFILLNPSTADAGQDDPTLRRVMGFARAAGHGGVRVVNLFALRATDPRALHNSPDPIGPENDRHLTEQLRACDGAVICAWGAQGGYRGRDAQVLARLAGAGVPLWHLGLTAGGKPRHPLYLPATIRPQRWVAEPWPPEPWPPEPRAAEP